MDLCGFCRAGLDGSLPLAVVETQEDETGAQQLIEDQRSPRAIQAPAKHCDRDERDQRADDHDRDHDDKCGELGIACTAQSAGEDELGSLQRLDQRDHLQDDRADFGDFGLGVVIQLDDIPSEEEYHDFLTKYPEASQWLRRYMGSADFINNKLRYCLWLDGVSPVQYRKNADILRRLQNVAELRQASPTKGFKAAADTPMLFAEIRQPDSTYLVVPEVSSQRRRYIPIGYNSPDIIASNTVYLVPNVDLFMFGVMTSNVHMAWTRVVCSRMKSDYRYTPAVYNNFPWPTPTDVQKAKIEQTAQAILDARALYTDCSLADLYDEVTMPPELRKAHQQNDKAVMEAYGMSVRETTEASCVAELMRRYQELIKQS